MACLQTQRALFLNLTKTRPQRNGGCYCSPCKLQPQLSNRPANSKQHTHVWQSCLSMIWMFFSNWLVWRRLERMENCEAKHKKSWHLTRSHWESSGSSHTAVFAMHLSCCLSRKAPRTHIAAWHQIHQILLTNQSHQKRKFLWKKKERREITMTADLFCQA